jgi:hypothetical protein
MMLSRITQIFYNVLSVHRFDLGVMQRVLATQTSDVARKLFRMRIYYENNIRLKSSKIKNRGKNPIVDFNDITWEKG